MITVYNANLAPSQIIYKLLRGPGAVLNIYRYNIPSLEMIYVVHSERSPWQLI